MICHLVINKDFNSKSCNQLECVCTGYTKMNKRVDMSVGCIMDGNLFLIGDIFLTLIRSNQTVSVSVVYSMLLTVNNISFSSVNITVIKAALMSVKVSGQLLTIIHTNPSESVYSLPASPQFLWDGRYVKSHLDI